MRKFAALAVIALLTALGLGSLLQAQTSTLPVPSGVGTAGQVLVFTDANNVQGSAAPTFATSAKIGSSGTALTQVTVYAQSVSPSIVTAQTCQEQSVTVTGVSTADKIVVNPPTIAASPGAGAVAARASAANTVAVVYCNPAGSNATPASGTYNFIAIRS